MALSVAGSDCSAGAGIQADLKTFTACGVFGLTAVTCVVAETPGEVRSIDPVAPEILRDQLEILLRRYPVAAVKTGMLYTPEHIAVTARGLRAWVAGTPGRLVVDPVMVASSGDPLLRADALAVLCEALLPLAAVMTPNLDEAGALLGEPVDPAADLEPAAIELARRYGVAVLLKGGHSRDRATDVLAHASGAERFTAPRVEGVVTHGTGCTLSAALAAGLARGLALGEAVAAAKHFVTAAIRGHYRWPSGITALRQEGPGP